MGILDEKQLLITGVLNTSSIAYHIASVARDEGAEIILTGFGRGLSITRRVAAKLGADVQVIELDAGNPTSVDQAAVEVGKSWAHLDGIVHAIGYAPPSCLDKPMLEAPWEDVAIALQVSAFSLSELARAFRPLLAAAEGASIVGLDFDATVAWPGYNWMGVAKAGLESLSRYLARELGGSQIRVNLISAGPIRTIAAKSIEAFKMFQDNWGDRSPLGWDPENALPVARSVVALLSDFFPMTTGELIHVDGGYHAFGA
ncbi:MAG: enoyl-ACP reductase FabI [Ferrimicrobium sp.]|uniref:enoyl-ACP reductase FabI n=1 Tax=Ferrimicrobium sp. TaxID=2926050 RepID=UPI00262978BB|nr:enoyl-ACP reductase FabI [Ferrimicrobium sp.]